MERWVVSACLVGRPCRYDACSRSHDRVLHEVRDHERAGGEVVAVCPEELGGLTTPRPAADLRDGAGLAVLEGTARVRRVHDDVDVTEAFVEGARRAAQQAGVVQRAILKARSPSCGVGSAYIDGRLSEGDGVFAALLRQTGVQLRSEDDL